MEIRNPLHAIEPREANVQKAVPKSPGGNSGQRNLPRTAPAGKRMLQKLFCRQNKREEQYLTGIIPVKHVVTIIILVLIEENLYI